MMQCSKYSIWGKGLTVTCTNLEVLTKSNNIFQFKRISKLFLFSGFNRNIKTNLERINFSLRGMELRHINSASAMSSQFSLAEL